MDQGARESEIQTKDQWVQRNLIGLPGRWPFSFSYDGHASDDLLAAWPETVDSVPLDDQRTQHTRTWSDPRTGLQVTCVAIDYAGFPVVEWTLSFLHRGQERTPILERILGVD